MSKQTFCILMSLTLFASALAVQPNATAQERRVPTKEEIKKLEGKPSPAAAKIPDAAGGQGRSNKPEVFFCQTPTAQCRSTGATFTVDRLRDLYVFVTWPNTSGTYTQTVEFYLPNGNLYVKKSTHFMVRKGQPVARPLSGETLPAEFFTTSRGVPAVVTLLPVAGTYITQRNLLGTWTVRVLLNGSPAASAVFELSLPDIL
jgi:hypothetical protein